VDDEVKCLQKNKTIKILFIMKVQIGRERTGIALAVLSFQTLKKVKTLHEQHSLLDFMH